MFRVLHDMRHLLCWLRIHRRHMLWYDEYEGHCLACKKHVTYTGLRKFFIGLQERLI